MAMGKGKRQPTCRGDRGVVVATVSGTTRAAAYERMYRLRSGFYDRSLPEKAVAAPVQLKIEFIRDDEPSMS